MINIKQIIALDFAVVTTHKLKINLQVKLLFLKLFLIIACFSSLGLIMCLIIMYGIHTNSSVLPAHLDVDEGLDHDRGLKHRYQAMHARLKNYSTRILR